MDKRKIGNTPAFVLFTFKDGTRFYIRTSLQEAHEHECLLDLLTGKQINKKFFTGGSYSVTDDEPLQYREQSNLLKSFM